MKSQTHTAILTLIQKSLQSGNFDRNKILNQLSTIGIDRDLIENTYFEISDEITARILIKKKQRRASIAKKAGPILTILGILLSLLSFLKIFQQQNYGVFFYGAITVGLLSWFQAKKSLETIELELKIRDKKIKNWF